MQIQLNDPDRLLTDELSAHIEQALTSGLAAHAERLTRAEVYVRDVNAHKGGADKHFTLEVRPRGLDPVVAEHVGENLPDAFRAALEKLQRVLERRFGRLSARDRGLPG